MKLLVDMNLSPRWIDLLTRSKFEAVHWSSVGTTAQRYLRNAQICERLFQASSHALWQKLAAMHRRNYQHVMILLALGKDIASNELPAESSDPPLAPDA